MTAGRLPPVLQQPCALLTACPPARLHRCSFNFLEIVELLNCVYCLGQLLEFVAFIWLRIK